MSRNGMLAAGLLCAGLGGVIVLVGAGVVLLPWHPPAPGWVVSLVGGIVLIAGIATLVRVVLGGAPDGELPTPPSRARAIQLALVVTLFACVAVVGSWVAFGPGPRRFAGDIPFLSGLAGEIAGRCAFGIGAIVTWAGTLLVAAAGWSKLRRQPKA